MSTISNVVIVGVIAGTVDRKTVKDKALAEFRIEGVGLRISAWDKTAAAVPESGLVLVNGYLSTRAYEWEGKQRESTDIRATGVHAISTLDSDEPF